MTPLDEKSQQKLIQAVENADQASFNKILLGKESPGLLDYVFPTGKFTHAQEMFQGLVSKNLEKLQAESRILPTAQEAGGFFRGGQLPFTPTSVQQQPIIPTPDEAAMLQQRDLMQGPRRPEEQFQPLTAPIQPGQVIGMDPTKFNPQSKLTPFQSGLLEEAGKGQIVLPGQQFFPTTLAKETKPDKPSYHFTTMFNPSTGREEEVKVNSGTNEMTFLGPKGSPEAAKAKKATHDLEYRKEVENEAKTRIGRAFGFAGFKESPFDAAGNIDIARLLAPGAMDLDKLTYWAQSAIDEPGLQKPVKVQLEHFLKQIKDAAGRAKKAPEAPKAGSVLKFDKQGNPIK